MKATVHTPPVANVPGQRDTTTRRAISALAHGLDRAYGALSLAALRIAITTRVFEPYQPIAALKIRVSEDKEREVLTRWEAIRKELPPPPISTLDIGCNVGFYVVESARLGNFASGLDTPMYSKALSVVRKALSLDNINPIGMRLTPETARALPQYDCIIMLQVFHHLCVAFGKVAAEEMLRTVYGKATKQLFFETEANYNSEEPFQSAMPDMGGNADEWVRSFFEGLGCRSIRPIHWDEEKRRSLFVIEK